MLYKARNKALQFYDAYSLMMSNAKNKALKGTGLKTLTHKQILPIALAQVKAGKLFILCINQNISLKKYTIIYSNLFNNV